MTRWALSHHSHLASDCCLWTLDFESRNHRLSANPDGQDTLEHLLRMRQGHYLLRAQLFECLPLSSRSTVAKAKNLEQDMATSSSLQRTCWLTCDLSLSSFSRVDDDSFPHSKNSCSFLELLGELGDGVRCLVTFMSFRSSWGLLNHSLLFPNDMPVERGAWGLGYREE